MRLTRWLAGAAAALGLALALAPLGQAQAMTPASSGAASAVQSIVGEGTMQARFGGHFGGGHFHGGGGGFHHFHGGGFYRPHAFYRPHVFVGPRFYHRPRFYAAYPGPYFAPVYRCPVVWTVYGPRRICAYRRHVVHYYGRRFAHRHHYVRHFRHSRWM